MLLSWSDDDDDDEKEEYDVLWNKGRAVFGGVLICVRSVEVREEGIVRDLVGFICGGGVDDGESPLCITAVTDSSESEASSLVCWVHALVLCEFARGKTGDGAY